MNQVTSASLRYPLSVFNKNSTLKETHTQNHRKYTGLARIVPEQSQGGRCHTWSVVRSNKPHCIKTEVPSAFFWYLLRSGAMPRPFAPPKDGLKEGGRARGVYKTVGQCSQLLITHVLDSCVKLLAVLHISSVQGRSVDRTSAGSS